MSTHTPAPPTNPATPPRRWRTPLGLLGVLLVLLIVGVLAVVTTRDGHAPNLQAPGTAALGGEPLPAEITRSRVTAGGDAARESAGIPVGYAQTRQGAVAAATNYLMALSSDGMLIPSRRPEVVDVVYASQVRAETRAGLDADWQRIAQAIGVDANGDPPPGKVAVVAAYPRRGAFKVVSYSPMHAVVEIWCPTSQGLMAGSDDHDVYTGWAISRMELVWVDGDWKLLSIGGQDNTQAPHPADIKGVPSLAERAALWPGSEVYANAETS